MHSITRFFCVSRRGCGDFPALRARAHISAPGGAVDYDASHLWITGLSALWISRHFVLGRIYPHLTVLWIRGLELED